MTTNSPKLSIAIPTHDMQDKRIFLIRLLDSLWNQTFQDFEIVITDNSDDDSLEEICEYYKTGIRYMKNKRKGMAQNTNEAIKQSNGEWVKILYLDDYLLHDTFLEDMVKKIKKSPTEWLVAGAKNNPDPHWTDDIHTGNNRLGSPSALTIRRATALYFDEKLTWLLDCDLYRRYYDKYGPPVLMQGKHIGMGLGEHQMTNLLSEEVKDGEFKYLINKYA